MHKWERRIIYKIKEAGGAGGCAAVEAVRKVRTLAGRVPGNTRRAKALESATETRPPAAPVWGAGKGETVG